MAETSWPAQNHSSGAVSDTEYEQLAHPQAADGMVGTPAGTQPVYADSTGRQVKVRADRFGLVRGFIWWSGSTEVTKAIAANSSGQTRIDLVVLRLTRSTGDVTVQIVAGTPGAGAPALTNNTGTTGVWEMALATVTVLNGAATITAAQCVRSEWYLGEPLIICTAATRPPHSPGRRIWQTDTATGFTSDGTAWLVTLEDTDWLSASAASGWTLLSGEYRRRNGMVTAVVIAQRTGSQLNPNTASLLTTLPVGYRPSLIVPVAAICNTPFEVRAQVNNIGQIAIDTYGAILATGRAVSLTVTYPVD